MPILLMVVALWWPLSSLSAQDSLRVAPGTRVRVTVESSLTTPALSTGVYRELTDTALLLASGTSTLTIPLASIAQLERSQGRRPSIAGGVVGFVVGAAAGVGVACMANRDSYGVPCVGDNDAPFLLGVGLGGTAGAVLLARLLGREAWSIIGVDQLLVPSP